MSDDDRLREARRILIHAVDNIEFYQVLESLDMGATEEDAEAILELINSARIEVGP